MHLSNEQLNELKKKLVETQTNFRSVVDSLEKTDPASDVDRLSENSDLGDEATEDRELIRHESLQSESNLILSRVEEALARMEEGTYGVTAEGEEIPFERLMADPTATTLVK